jgi:hypothetical protein
VRRRVRQDLLLDAPSKEVVGRLERLDRKGRAERLHLRGVEVRHADVADLAQCDGFRQCSGRLLERGGGVRPMDLVDVDVVSSERPQAVLEPLAIQAGPASRATPPPVGRSPPLVAMTTWSRG